MNFHLQGRVLVRRQSAAGANVSLDDLLLAKSVCRKPIMWLHLLDGALVRQQSASSSILCLLGWCLL